jgi:hypothetical protein
MKIKVSRIWLLLTGALMALVALNPVAVITLICLPLVSLGILGDPVHHAPKFTVSRSSSGQPKFFFDDYTWNSRNPYIFPIEVTNSSAKHAERNAWTIKCIDQKNFRLKELEYGSVPRGWTEVFPAKPIAPGDYYTINHGDLFSKTDAGEFEHLTPDEFYYKAQHHQLYKDSSKDFKFP